MVGCKQRNQKLKNKKMENDRSLLIEQLKQATNVLITVNNNPTVDQLSACIGLTLLLNKLGKHGTAVFSGEVPSTLEFLKPEETIEKNTDSLRDFIISLDKAKADKLRYKVEDTMVKIFITPYKTSISDKDLEFSQGDFNVDVVIALGIHDREQLDQAIVAHGRILHDATVISVNTQTGNNLGTINWVDEQASSLCEMLASIADELQPQSLDAQMATALLTGVVAETERFSNEKTSSVTMNVSSKLMAVGANQQLIATQLEAPEPELIPEPEQLTEEPKHDDKDDDGAILIDHPEDKHLEIAELPPIDPVDPNEIHIDNEGTLKKAAQLAEEEQAARLKQAEEVTTVGSMPDQQAYSTPSNVLPADQVPVSYQVTEPPVMGGTLTAGAAPEPLEPSTDPLSSSIPVNEPVLDHTENVTPQPMANLSDIVSQSSPGEEPDQDVDPIAVANQQSLQQLEESVHSDASATSKTPGVVAPTDAIDKTSAILPVVDPSVGIDSARDAVQNVFNDAVLNGVIPPETPAAFNAQPVNLDMGHDQQSAPSPVGANMLDSSTGQQPFPTNLVPPTTELPAENTGTTVENPSAPPPVPPPMMPPVIPQNPQA